MQTNIRRFGNEVLKTEVAVQIPPPLPSVEFSVEIMATKPHDALLADLHEHDPSVLETAMLERVAELLARHARAVDTGDLPFRDPSASETAEGDPAFEPIEPHDYEDPESSLNPLLGADGGEGR